MVESSSHTQSGISLLRTKLFSPKWRSESVARPRLVDQVAQGATQKLTLISAPAGFGKSTLLAEWLASDQGTNLPVAWVSLDASDNDPALFWSYMITSLQGIQDDLGRHTMPLLYAPQAPSISSVLTTLINEINLVDCDFVVVLDDYHVIDNAAIQDGMTFLLNHLPAQMHMVVASRVDPQFPLARMRARGQLTELRAADLRFSSEEVSGFLNQMMGLELSTADIEALEKRTEGWVAGLQLAACSMQGRTHVGDFIDAFSGDDRYIVDYLIEEVLQQQPEHIRQFLLHTSVLDRLSGPLCDAVTGFENGGAQLEMLERNNLFVVPLDDTRTWYRYHHLFADVLRAQLAKSEPDQVPELHLKASSWFEANQAHTDAVRHAFQADDVEHAAGLIESVWRVMDRNYHTATVLRWIGELPDRVVASRPVLGIAAAWGLLSSGNIERAEQHLESVEASLKNGASLDKLVGDATERMLLPGTLASAKAYLAQTLDNHKAALKYAEEALDLLPADNFIERAIPSSILSIAYWGAGDLDAAYDAFVKVRSMFEMGGSDIHLLGISFGLAEIRMAQGRLQEAFDIYDENLKFAAKMGTPIPRGMADLHVGLGKICLERRNLDDAVAHLKEAEKLGEHVTLPGNEDRWFIVMGRLKETQGDLEGALKMLLEAASRKQRDPLPETQSIDALITRMWLKLGLLTKAKAWVAERGLSVKDNLSYLLEFDHLTLIRVLIHTAPVAALVEALGMLEEIVSAAYAGSRKGHVIEALVLKSLILQRQNNIVDALRPLEEALVLAEEEGFVQVFTGEGAPMRMLLRQAVAEGIGGAFTRHLLTCMASSVEEPGGRQNQESSLIVPLTSREKEILRLIAAGLRNQEIADQLFISLATVKRHIANAYGKLEVSHRTEAIVRLNELGLV